MWLDELPTRLPTSRDHGIGFDSLPPSQRSSGRWARRHGFQATARLAPAVLVATRHESLPGLSHAGFAFAPLI